MGSKEIILIDSNNIAYRAFYALPQTITTSTGQITNAVYGFTSMLLKLIDERNPETIICAFDSRGPTFRHEAYDAYKATRKKMPDELIGQMPLIKEVADALNIKSLEMEGYEADDIIATLAKRCRELFDEVIILSSDKDILQLVSQNIKVLALKKGITDTILYTGEEVIKKFGVKPENIKDLLALMGDSSDNIPGVPGIGPKTAAGLMEEFGSVKEIYDHIDRVKGEKLKNLLVSEEDSAKKSLELTGLKDDLDISADEAISNKISDIDFKKAESVFNSLEFNTLKKRLGAILDKRGQTRKNGDNAIEENHKPAGNEGNGSLKKITGRIFVNQIDPGLILNSGEKKVFLSVSSFSSLPEPGCSSGEFLFIKDIDGNFYIFDAYTISDAAQNGPVLKILENNEVIKSGFYFKTIYKFLKKYGIDLNGSVNDYRIQYLLLNPEKSRAGIKDLFSELLGMDFDLNFNPDLNKESGNVKINTALLNDTVREEAQESDRSIEPSAHSGGQMNFGFDVKGNADVPEKEENLEQEYLLSSLKNIIDSGKANQLPELVQMLYFNDMEEKLSERIIKEGFERLYNEIEAPLIKVLADMEFKGVNIDRDYLNMLIKEYDEDIKNLTNRIHALCNSNFNINSTQQLAKILYEKLNLTATKKTKTGYSTNAAALISIQDSHPAIEKILDYREKVKLKNTYIDVLPDLIDPEDGRVHTTYNQLGTTTGRISSNNPNLQNIPVRTDLGRQIRKAFIPGKGYELLLSADYSQIELRILAHLADDRDLVKAFKTGRDIHSETAAEIFGVKYDKVSEDLRRKAKAINFGILYGMTEFGLKIRLSISEEEAKRYISLYFSRYPDVKKYLNSLIASAYKTGYTSTMFGRKRYIRELASTNANIRNLGERLAVNAPIQGSAADIMKLATVVLFEKIQERGYDCNLILHVHDEIVLELKEKDLQQVKEIVTTSMENCISLKTGLKVDIKTGENWFI